MHHNKYQIDGYVCLFKQLSTDTRKIDFGTTVIGETLRRTFTLTNKGALGTKYEFFKVDGRKERTVTTAATSLGRMVGFCFIVLDILNVVLQIVCKTWFLLREIFHCVSWVQKQNLCT